MVALRHCDAVVVPIINYICTEPVE